MEYRRQKEEDGEREERNGGEMVYYYGKLDMEKKKHQTEIKKLKKKEKRKNVKREIFQMSVCFEDVFTLES